MLAVLLPLVTAAQPATAEGQELAPRVSQLFGAGHDDPGNVSWLSVNYGNTSTGGNRLYAGSEDYLLATRQLNGSLEVLARHDGGMTTDVVMRPPEDGKFTPGFYEGARYPDGRWAPSVRLDRESDRCSEWGSFEIKDITPDLDRLWLVFSPGCQDGSGGVAGEVRFNMPGDPELDAAPSTVDLFHTPVGTYVRPIAITLMNRSDRALRVSDLSIVGSDAWSRRWSTCIVIAAGDFCRIWARFTPPSTGAHEATLRATTTAGIVSVPLRGVGHAPVPGSQPLPAASEEDDAPPQPGLGVSGQPRSVWLMKSERDMWVGNGRAHSFGPQDGYGVAGADGGFAVSGRTSTSRLSGFLSAPAGEALLPGAETRGLTSDSRTVRISGDGRGCGSYEGDLRVLEADYDLFGHIERLAVTYRMNCAGRTANLWGTIAHNALGPVPDPPGYPSRSSVNARYGTRTPAVGKPFAVVGRFASRGPARPRGLIVEYRDARSSSWFGLARGRADLRGRYSIRAEVSKDVQVRVRFPGTGEIAPSSSAPRWIRPR